MEKARTPPAVAPSVAETLIQDLETGLPAPSINAKPIRRTATGLSRKLKSRHITMISVGGVIGTGLFIGSATALQNGGPIGKSEDGDYRAVLWYPLLGRDIGMAFMSSPLYSSLPMRASRQTDFCWVTRSVNLVASVCWAVMVSLGEMVALFPIEGGHITLAERFVNPALSFALGYNYWYYWTIGVPIEITASSILMNYWTRDPSLTPAWITMCTVVVILINVFGAGIYGEAEFFFASIKVFTIIGLMILSVVLFCGGGPNHDILGFRYWINPGPFVQYYQIPGPVGRFAGFWAVLAQDAFSFIGTEVVAMAAGEAKDPRKSLPRAIRNVYIIILSFYLGGTLFIGLLVPSDDPGLNLADGTAASSPFTIAVERAGITVLPSIINACILSSAWSSASSMLYSSSRALYALSVANNAPKIFSRTLDNGLPFVALACCSLFTLIAFMSINKGAGTVFGWLANLTTVAGLMSWLGISFTYIRFYMGMRFKGIDRNRLPYRSPFQPYVAYYAIVMCIILSLSSGYQVFLKGGWRVDDFVTNYLPLVLFPALYTGSRIYTKKSIMQFEEMDFTTDFPGFERREKNVVIDDDSKATESYHENSEEKVEVVIVEEEQRTESCTCEEGDAESSTCEGTDAEDVSNQHPEN
ncbi:amino acid permease [Flagelloscypha sp. PMI_526]|nr:amino acid permease [Flagelloscypha sp. PMI_526]